MLDGDREPASHDTPSATPSVTSWSSPAPATVRSTFLTGDVVARLGGDEFAVLLRDLPGAGARQYDPTIRTTRRSSRCCKQLRRAIDDGRLRLHHQPEVVLREGRTVGSEALVRWEHPERGLLAPGAFLPLAERTAVRRPLTHRPEEVVAAR